MDSTIMKIIKHEKRLKALGMEKLCRWDFAHDNRQNPRATNIILDYTANFKEMLEEGTGMIIYGNTGAGKTFAAAQIVNELTDRGYENGICFTRFFPKICWYWTTWVRKWNLLTRTRFLYRS